MSRTARKTSSIATYHVIIRGLDHQLIFEERNDYLKYLDLLNYYKTELDFELYAYCLMNNHVHLLIHTGTESLSSIFQHLNTAYAVWYNMKYQRSGCLQQGRFYSEPIETQSYLINAIHYIHYNPCKAGLEKYPGHSYQWSSLQDYLQDNDSLVNVSFIYEIMESKMQFLNYQQQVPTTNCLEIKPTKIRIPDDVAKEIIKKETNCPTISDFQNLSILERNQYILHLYEKGISIRQLNRLTGISKGVIGKILQKSQVLDKRKKL